MAHAIDAEVKALNDDPDALDALLDRQNYRLAFWRTASDELDYRRFFNIETLVGLRVEDRQVFDDTHGLIESLVAGGLVDGLRVDHVDGLRDPAGLPATGCAAASGGAWVVVEKILAPDEELPDTWPVAGTTGYDFLNRVNGLFVDSDNLAPADRRLPRLHRPGRSTTREHGPRRRRCRSCARSWPPRSSG